ncbi:MAG: aminotransferase class III-fold pyridoxal phosphate-dependent enzyme, partial [Acidimicrobiales bacterium]
MSATPTPHVVEAIQQQAATLNVQSRYLHEGGIDYAERLLDKHHPSLDRVVFTCTGTEANEVAITMARFATRGRGIICTDSAYHGNSELVGKLTWAGGRSDPEIRSVRFPQTYRPIEEGLSEAELCDRYLADVADAIESFAAAGVPLAGMLVCSLFANEGLPNIPSGYMARAADMVRAAGGLFVADEVQAGFCRGGRWWGYEVNEFVPDIATMGKPMGSGVPLAGVV